MDYVADAGDGFCGRGDGSAVAAGVPYAEGALGAGVRVIDRGAHVAGTVAVSADVAADLDEACAHGAQSSQVATMSVTVTLPLP